MIVTPSQLWTSGPNSRLLYLNSVILLMEGGSNRLEYVGILKVFLDYREEREVKLVDLLLGKI